MKILQRILIVTIIFSAAFSRPVDLKEAIGFAENYLKDKTLQSSRLIADNIYLHNYSEGGFLIMSGDDAFPAVLAFSEKGKMSEMPPAFLEYCKSYSDEINENLFNTVKKHSSWENLLPLSKNMILNEVQPLLSSTWHQMHHYNTSFPFLIDSGYTDQHAYAGCVAVCGAQIMKYYEYPTKGFGSHSYYSDWLDTLLSVNYDTSYYNWGLMPDSLCTRDGDQTAEQDEIDEVSRFLLHIAIALENQFLTWASGTQFEFLFPAMVSYFDYSPDMEFKLIYDYDDSTWATMLKEELEAGRPIPYAGGGHAFICDGYKEISDTLEYFHFNWGWGGYYDGWFLISALRPQPTCYFNRGERAFFGVIPNNNSDLSLAYNDFSCFPLGWRDDFFSPVRKSRYPEYVYDGFSARYSRDSNQWIATSEIHIPNAPGASLSFWLNMDGKEKQCHVMLGYGGNEDSCFITEIGFINSDHSGWVNYSYDLTSYKNKDIYIGIQFMQDSIFIDEMKISIPKANLETEVFQPNSFVLIRNYPNPFNPVTTIDYWLSSASKVNLSIYDITGKKITSLVNNIQKAGDYSIAWNASAYPSGIYLCTLSVNGILIGTQKLALVK